MKITEKDLKRHLDQQINFLTASINSYDSGNRSEAVRMAVSARILLHDTKRQKSIITQLDIKDDILLLSSATQYYPDSIVTYLGLCGLNFLNGRADYIPYCQLNRPNRRESWFKLDDWWNELVIDDKSYKFTRKDIVLLLADIDGGAHVDPAVYDEYSNLKYNKSIGWSYFNIVGICAISNNSAYSIMRQIAHEIIQSFSMNTRIVSSTKNTEGCALAIYLPRMKLGSSDTKEVVRYFAPGSSKTDPSLASLVLTDAAEMTENREVYIEEITLSDQSLHKRVCVV